MKSSTSAKEVAQYLVWLAAHECEDDPDFLTPLKLQKLLYFVQGWAVAEWGNPLFSERIEAWREGPVVPEVYQQFKGCERSPIQPPSVEVPSSLDEQERALIHSVWDAYKGHSAFALRDLTHQEQPWLSRYKPQDPAGRCTAVISADDLKRAFRGRLEGALQRLHANRARLKDLAAKNTQALTGRDVI
jgi:uncharacterized phage-associated protein